MGEKKKMGKNGHGPKKSKIPFFSKEKNGRTQKKKKAKNGTIILKRPKNEAKKKMYLTPPKKNGQKNGP